MKLKPITSAVAAKSRAHNTMSMCFSATLCNNIFPDRFLIVQVTNPIISLWKSGVRWDRTDWKYRTEVESPVKYDNPNVTLNSKTNKSGVFGNGRKKCLFFEEQILSYSSFHIYVRFHKCF